MKHKIGILGFGTVGQGLAEILLSKKEELKSKYGYEFDIVAVGDFKFGNVYNANGLDIPSMLKEASVGKKFSKDITDWDNINLIKNSDTSVWCELTFTDLVNGGPAVDHVKTALKAGKHIVTSNKGPAALCYPEMKKIADENNCKFMIEGTVVAGTPVINLADGPLAGCKITKIRGILNGTTNYMLTEMEKGMPYDEVLKVAQSKGYAEADPTGDVEGYDARGKVTILANIVMGAGIKITDVPCEGITKITPKDIEKAKSQNKRWKLIGSVELTENGVDASVKPEMIDISHPLAGVSGATNALTFTTDLLGDVTIVGPGAGKIETGFSILTDLIKIHRG
ncbi:MAG: homoserine dehydrogenase [Bacteroidales bacterium]|nr:homoserine dehydrogenase [Bacteroidales bacterium]MCF8405321.1 homoserine dehydrogenase [Bacteroidales bacterium]